VATAFNIIIWSPRNIHFVFGASEMTASVSAQARKK